MSNVEQSRREQLGTPGESDASTVYCGTVENPSVVRVTAKPPPPAATEHMVRMRDGICLATDVYLPQSGLPTESVLVRLPYDKGGEYCFMPELAPRFTARGYAVVVQDVRGKFRSEGETLPWINEVYDAYDTLDWIVAQEWSNGRVGMFGDSYFGYTQWAAVSSRHAALKAIVPRFTGTQLGARLDDDDPEWSLERYYRASFWVDQDIYLWDMDWKRPYADGVERFFSDIGRRSAAWDLAFPESDPLRRFPNGHPFDAPAVPTLMVMGWFDVCSPWQWRDHQELSSRPAWSRLEYLRIEAIDHEMYHVEDAPIGEADDHVRNSAALVRLLDRTTTPALDFFDVFLREDADAPAIPKVTWEQVHDGWRQALTWPPPHAAERVLYLVGGDGIAGGLSDVAPDGEQALTWLHDPKDLVPTPVANSGAFLLEYPDERPLGEREDTLAFSGPELEEQLDLCGPAALEATVESAGSVIDVFVRLLDEAPDGSARLIGRGQKRVREADGRRSVTVPLTHVGYRVRAGHRLRVHIASSDFPDHIDWPGTDEHPWLAMDVQPTRQSLVVGGGAGAILKLTVVPADRDTA
ncbi:CocE/NonD family hydrolase [Streptomyces sp. NPDC057199]|uniref:CocE/NonD family hydrolase n=1 Tax=Streptomyces sp. NPDC057199 TaxID=3346047 RepID=UPI003641645C